MIGEAKTLTARAIPRGRWYARAPMPAKDTCATTLRLFAEALERLGGDMAPILAAAGIAPTVLADKEARIPSTHNRLFWRAAAEVTGDPRIGLHVGEVLHPRAVNLFGYLLLSNETLLHGLERVARYQGILACRPLVAVRRTARGVRVGVGAAFSDLEARAVHAEYMGAFLLQMLGWASETAIRPLEVHLAHAPRGPRADYERILGAPVRFGSDRSELLLEDRVLARPSRSANRLVATMLDEQAAALLASLEDASLAGRARRVLAEELDGSPPSLAEIARTLGMSSRSLQRGLAAERTSFRDVLDALRREVARDYLEGSEAPITEIAYLAGFSEVSAFSRAVSRWFGRPPARVRRESEARVA